MDIKVKSKFYEPESLETHCRRLSKKNNVILYKIEEYLGKKLLDDDQLAEIRDIILTVSAEIKELPNNLQVDEGASNEGLQ